MVADATAIGSVGSFDYELELLHNQSSGEKDSNQSQRWISMEMCHGTYSSDDCANDIAVIKFDKPVAIMPHTKYALRLRNHGAKLIMEMGVNQQLKAQMELHLLLLPVH